VRQVAAIYLWELTQGLQNRFLQVFALACLAGGAGLLAAAPGADVLPLVLIQAILFFGSLLALLVGWSSGQQVRGQGPFLFAQPIGSSELIVGQLLGTASWCALLLLLFMGPATVNAANPGALLALAGLAIGFTLVCVMGGLVIGLKAAPVSGLLAALLAWAVAVAGWELGLLLLAELAWIQQSPAVFLSLLLANPAGVFRVGALVGLDSVPFDAAELETGRWVFQYVEWVALVIFAAWLVVLGAVGTWAVHRQEM